MPRPSVVPGFRFYAKEKRAHFEVTLPGTQGRIRRRKTVRVESRDAALVLFRRFRRDTLARRDKEPELFAEYVRRFWPLIRVRLSEKTALNETWMIEKLILPFIGNHRLEKINLALVRDFAALLRSRSYAPATINMALSVLRKILNDAVAREIITEFPAKGRLPMEKETPLRLELSTEEKARFLSAFDHEPSFRDYFARHRSPGRVASSPHFGGTPRVFGGGLRPEGEAVGLYFERLREIKPLFVVALQTGLRRGDLLRLRWSSIDFRAGFIRVAVEKTKREAVIPISEACRHVWHCTDNLPGHADHDLRDAIGFTGRTTYAGAARALRAAIATAR